jgi:hypothetical protein
LRRGRLELTPPRRARPAPPARAAILLLAAFAAAPPLLAATLPPGVVQRVLADDLASPTALAALPDGRILVAEQRGTIRIVGADGESAETLHTVAGVAGSAERGLLGLAPHPDFARNGWLYYYYTAAEPALHGRLARVRIAQDAAVGPEEALHDFPPVADAMVHFGGALHFSPDGTLFVAVGDHGLGSPSQSLSSAFGKLHRFLDEGTPAPGNPFAAFPGAYPSVWAYGLRNPFTFAFQPETGRLFVNDVGGAGWEEIDEGVPGANYGWPLVEGPSDHPDLTPPLYAYPHAEGACAITGGVFLPRGGGDLSPLLAGRYLFADYCLGWLRALDPETLEVEEFASGLGFPTNLGVDAHGRALFLSRGTAAQGTATRGLLVRLEATERLDLPPNILRQPADAQAAIGERATFSVAVDGADALRWQRDGTDVPGATADSISIPAVAAFDHGARFRVIASNRHGTVASDEAVLELTANAAPRPRIEAPLAPAFAPPGATVAVRGAATDREDGELAASALAFEVVWRHDAHVHPLLAPVQGIAEGSFTMPAEDHGPGLAWVEIVLTATDAGGRSATVRRAVYPASFAEPSRPDLLALGQGRFRLAAAFLDPRDGVLRAAAAAPLGGDSGGFWFFDPANVEGVVKVLDGTPINGHFWLYYGALTDLEHTLSALDLATGEVRRYFNPRGRAASFGDVEALPAEPGTANTPAPEAATGSPPAGDPDLPLMGGRFRCSVDWSDPRSGLAGSAVARALTDQAGLFWFFDPSNLEMAVKLLDGAGTNGHFWLFHAGMTDLETTLTILDTVTGAVRTVHKPPFAYAAGADVELFGSP